MSSGNIPHWMIPWPWFSALKLSEKPPQVCSVSPEFRPPGSRHESQCMPWPHFLSPLIAWRTAHGVYLLNNAPHTMSCTPLHHPPNCRILALWDQLLNKLPALKSSLLALEWTQMETLSIHCLVSSMKVQDLVLHQPHSPSVLNDLNVLLSTLTPQQEVLH
jgi:hypothetical protein